MTTEERKQFFEGKELWYKYQKINGYAFAPTNAGLKKLAEQEKITPSKLRKKINYFLDV